MNENTEVHAVHPDPCHVEDRAEKFVRFHRVPELLFRFEHNGWFPIADGDTYKYTQLRILSSYDPDLCHLLHTDEVDELLHLGRCGVYDLILVDETHVCLGHWNDGP